MKMKEMPKQPEIFIEEATQAVNKLKFKDREKFSYHHTNFLIVLSDTEPKDENIFFSASTAIDGYDIYIPVSFLTEEKKRAVFHEMIEVDLCKQGFNNEERHRLALQTEEQVLGKRPVK